MYSLLEILNWGPFQPNRERLGYGIQWAADPQDELFRPAFGAVYANHQYDNDGNLIGYDFDGAFSRSLGSVGGFPYQRKECMAMFGPGQVSFAKPIKTSVLMRNNTYLPDEVAVRFKHRIVSIHCFPNGNGRHSRLMADIIAEKIFKQPVFTWGAINFINTDNARAAYLSAIKIADKGDIGPLINFARS